jgi:ATP-binding cassette subfamily C (CFTR/MRP) protein 4
MSEVLNGMRVIKMYAWEKAFAEVIGSVRAKEVAALLNTAYIQGMNYTFFFIIGSISMLTTFVPYQLAGHEVTAFKVFTTYGYYSILRYTVTFALAIALRVFSELRVGFQRFEGFLRLPETDPRVQLTPAELQQHSAQSKPPTAWMEMQDVTSLLSNGSAEPLVIVENVSAGWVTGRAVLQNVSFTLRKGSLFCVAGPVGCGKTTLLMTILGELAPSGGKVRYQGSMSYAPQESWILSTTVRENILFGEPFDEEWYKQVIEACAFDADIDEMDAGDETEIGERGVTLSGGQRARYVPYCC